MASSSKKIAQGVVWASSAQWGNQLLGFGIYAGLARLLNPQVFGLIAIAGIYIALMQVFVQQGFGMAIIQRRELEHEHLDSAFWIAMATAFLFCLLSLLLGGQIARMFHEPKIAPVIGWLSFSFLFYALSSVPTALLTRELDFRALAARSLIATTGGGAMGLAMAYFGWGVWSLVGQQLVNATLGCVCLWWAVPWRPSFRVSRRHLRDLYGFSFSITANDVMWFFCQKSDQTFVGYGFGPAGLGPYSLASRLVTLIHDSIIGPVQSVALPAFSKLQSEPSRFEQAVHKFCELSAFISLPVFAGLIVVAPELVPVLFGARWSPAVPILQVLGAYGALRVFLGFYHPLMLAKGRPGLYLVTNIILAGMTFVGCVFAVRWSPQVIGASLVTTMLAFSTLTLLIIKKNMEIKIGPLLKSFEFPFLSSFFMLAVVALLRVPVRKTFGPAPALALCVVGGVAIYVLAALCLRPDLVKLVREMLAHSLFPSQSLDSNGQKGAAIEVRREGLFRKEGK